MILQLQIRAFIEVAYIKPIVNYQPELSRQL